MEIPKLKGRVLTERITIPVTPETLRIAKRLKEAHNVDTALLLRTVATLELERVWHELEGEQAS